MLRHMACKLGFCKWAIVYSVENNHEMNIVLKDVCMHAACREHFLCAVFVLCFVDTKGKLASWYGQSRFRIVLDMVQKDEIAPF